MKEVPPLSDYVIQRASRLDHALERLHLSEGVLKTQEETGNEVALTWISPDATGQTEPEKGRMIFDADLIRGMKKVATTLYSDLRDEGEIDLARDIVEQNQPPSDYDMVETGQLITIPASDSSA